MSNLPEIDATVENNDPTTLQRAGRWLVKLASAPFSRVTDSAEIRDGREDVRKGLGAALLAGSLAVAGTLAAREVMAPGELQSEAAANIFMYMYGVAATALAGLASGLIGTGLRQIDRAQAPVAPQLPGAPAHG